MKDAMQLLIVLNDDGIVFYSQELQKDIDSTGPDEVLIGGAMVAITQITQEIVKREGALKVIKQEDYSIMLEEKHNIIVVIISIHELNIIRTKMNEFLNEFIAFYGDILKTWNGNLTLFLPTKRLVERFFG